MCIHLIQLQTTTTYVVRVLLLSSTLASICSHAVTVSLRLPIGGSATWMTLKTSSVQMVFVVSNRFNRDSALSSNAVFPPAGFPSSRIFFLPGCEELCAKHEDSWHHSQCVNSAAAGAFALMAQVHHRSNLFVLDLFLDPRPLFTRSSRRRGRGAPAMERGERRERNCTRPRLWRWRQRLFAFFWRRRYCRKWYIDFGVKRVFIILGVWRCERCNEG